VNINFFVGILPEDKSQLLNFVKEYNDKNSNSIIIKGEWDDPYGYYTFSLDGDWDAYDAFMGKSFVRSLEHFEE
jgi:hypothetical protein